MENGGFFFNRVNFQPTILGVKVEILVLCWLLELDGVVKVLLLHAGIGEQSSAVAS